MSTQPTHKVKKGGVSIAVFNNAYGKSFVLQKSYKKKDSEEWVNNSINLFEKELDQVADAVSEIKAKLKA